MVIDTNKFQFFGMMIRARADEINRQPSKIESQKAKKRNFRNDREKTMKNSIKAQKSGKHVVN